MDEQGLTQIEQDLINIRLASDYNFETVRMLADRFFNPQYTDEWSDILNKTIRTTYVYEDVLRDGQLVGMQEKGVTYDYILR